MKTKQYMIIKVADTELQVQHGSEMVKLNDVLKVGNEYRVKRGLRPYDRVLDILRDQEIAEYCATVELFLRNEVVEGNYIVSPKRTEVILQKANCDAAAPLDITYDKEGKAKLPIKDMVSINIKRGKYGGTWAHIDIAIRFMMKLDPEFAHAAVRILKDGHLLAKRDDGGEAHKALMEIIHKTFRPTQHDYAQISQAVKRAVFYDLPRYALTTKNIWNSPLATYYRQNLRREICDSLAQTIEFGYIHSIWEVLEAAKKHRDRQRKLNPIVVDGAVVLRR